MHSSIKKILSNKKNSVYIIDILPEMISCHLQLVPLKAWMLKWMSLFKNIFLGDSEGLGWSHLRSWINFCVEASFLSVVICSKTPRFAKVYPCHGGLQIIAIGKHKVYQSALADIELKMKQNSWLMFEQNLVNITSSKLSDNHDVNTFSYLFLQSRCIY